jgi:hypothetical protein
VRGGDVNGDGKMDLLIEFPEEPTPARRGAVHLYLGKEHPDTVSDFIFRDTHLLGNRSTFGLEFWVRDLNGDGCDDIILQGITGGQVTVYNFEVHLGNKKAVFGTPVRDLTRDQMSFTNVDLNLDGYMEWFPESHDSNPPFSWGRQDFMTQTFVPDAVFLNPLPQYYEYSPDIIQMRSINGLNGKNHAIGWAEIMIDGMSWWIYQSGPGWQTKAIAMYGIFAIWDAVYGGPHDLGDISGDNIPDFALKGGRYEPTPGKPCTVWIFYGNAKLVSAESVPSLNKASSFFKSVYPNPLIAHEDGQAYVRFQLDKPGVVEASIIDVLGRVRKRITKELYSAGACQIPMGVSSLERGQYFIVLECEQKREMKPFTIIGY